LDTQINAPSAKQNGANDVPPAPRALSPIPNPQSQIPNPCVSIIVVTFNSRAHFARLRASLEAQTEQRFRLIVVDNASKPDQRPLESDFPGAEILQLPENAGFAAANNLAARQAGTPFLALLNPDAFPEPAWLAELLAAAARWPDAASIGSTQFRDGAPGFFDGTGDEMFALGLPYRSGYGRRAHALPPERETFSACAAAALYRTGPFLDSGGFDEDFFCFGEDVDLGYRLRLLGHAAIQAPRAVVHHVGGASAGRRSAFADYHAARNRVWTFVKNAPAPFFQLTLPLHLAATLAMALANPARGRGWAGLKGWLAAFRDLPRVFAQRRAIQQSRRAPSRTLLRAMIWSPLDAARRAAGKRIANSE
jgi:GT2 family glycosyltransferase